MRAMIAMLVLLQGAPVAGAPCTRLSGEKRKLAHRIEQITFLYDCCDEKLARCLKAKRVCKLAKRVRDQICRLAGQGKSEKQIRAALDSRSRSMNPMARKGTFDLSISPAAGQASAAVALQVYACARCPLCAKVVPELYRLVTKGVLKGKARLHLRPFPLRGHAGAAEGGMAFMAAAALGKQWPLVLKVYQNFKAYQPSKLAAWAEQAGMERAGFEKQLQAKRLRKALVRSKKEGLRNGVKATPALFIDGRRYYGELDRESLIDVVSEAAERAQGKQHCGK